MPKKVKIKTTKNSNSVADYITSADPKLQADAKTLLKVFKGATGIKPHMWGEKRINKQSLLIVY